MKRSNELLNPPVVVKVALGELILKFARLIVRRPLSLRSSLELGTMFCDTFNEKTTTPRFTHGALVDIGDAVAQVNTDSQGFMLLSKAILEDEEPTLKVSDEDLAQNPDLLGRLADATFKVHEQGLESVFTPGLEKKLTAAGYNIIGGLLTDEEKMLHEEYMFHTPPSFVDPDVTQFEQHLLAQFRCFRVPRGKVEIDLDLISNAIISVALLVKAMDQAKLIDPIITYVEDRQRKSLPMQMQPLVSGKKAIFESALKPDLEFFIGYNLQDPEAVNYDNAPHSLISMAFKAFVQSKHRPEDLSAFIKVIMPFFGVIINFLNDAQAKEEAINSQKMQDLHVVETLVNKGEAKGASERLKELLSFFKTAETQDVTRQLMLGRTLMNMAAAKELQDEPLQSLVFYLRAQSVFGRLINIKDSKERYQQCDITILELESRIAADLSICKMQKQ